MPAWEIWLLVANLFADSAPAIDRHHRLQCGFHHAGVHRRVEKELLAPAGKRTSFSTLGTLLPKLCMHTLYSPYFHNTPAEKHLRLSQIQEIFTPLEFLKERKNSAYKLAVSLIVDLISTPYVPLPLLVKPLFGGAGVSSKLDYTHTRDEAALLVFGET